jgi:hypothetical protein
MRAKDDLDKINELQNEVQELCERFPVPEVMV